MWLLLSNRPGDNNQLLALADALVWPFEAKHIEYNSLRRVPMLRRGLAIVAARSRPLIKAPWPDLVIGSGYGTVPVARYIRSQTDGRAKLVHLGNARQPIDDFDLHISTPQYVAGAKRNLLELPFPIGNPARAAHPSFEELEWLRSYKKPRRLIAVGGPARHWQLDHTALANAIWTMRGKHPGGCLIIATSARTPQSTRRLLRTLVRGRNEAVVDDFPRFATLLAECDEIYVTADSVSMISEAVLSGKPVGMIPIRRSPEGRLAELLYERTTRQAVFPDFRNFWALLGREGLVGTVELPVASQVCDTVQRAAEAVRRVMDRGDRAGSGRT